MGSKGKIGQLSEEIWKALDGKINTLYFSGSRVYGAHVKSSDIDFFGIVNDKYDFSKEEALNKELSEKTGERVNFRGISLHELEGGNQQGTITKYVPLSILLRGFPLWKYVKGEDYALKEFKIKPANPKEELKRNVERLKEYRQAAEQNKLPFRFGDYLKTFLMSVEAIQEIKGQPYTLNYGEVAKRETDPEIRHIAKQCMKYRKGQEIDREKLLQEIDAYLSDAGGRIRHVTKRNPTA